jgi:hypothetical protein
MRHRSAPRRTPVKALTTHLDWYPISYLLHPLFSLRTFPSVLIDPMASLSLTCITIPPSSNSATSTLLVFLRSYIFVDRLRISDSLIFFPHITMPFPPYYLDVFRMFLLCRVGHVVVMSVRRTLNEREIEYYIYMARPIVWQWGYR